MVILGSNDVFKVHKATLVADYDRETLTNLYQPLIGYSALALYFTLWSEGDMQRVNPVSAHDTLLAKMKISVGEFIKARKALEGVGLLRTYLEDNSGAKIYTYELFAPKTPNEFFSDTLLYGLLINYIGEVDAKKLNNYYSSSFKIDGNDISSSFKEVFRPDFQNAAFIKALNNDPALGRNRAKMSLEFTFSKFFDALKEVSQISEKAFSKAELKEIMRLASLNGLDEVKAANIVANFYDPSLEKGKRVDFNKVTKAFQEETNYSYLSNYNKSSTSKKHSYVSSSGALAQKINIMESVSPKDYLTILQNGTEPALPDLKLIDYLSKKFRLNNSVINAVIDYTLEKNNNVLSKAYCEKICASLARSNIETTVDAMNYLKSISKGRKMELQKEDKLDVEVIEENIKPKKKTSSSNKEDDKEWESLMAELEEIGDDNDGKA